MSLVGKFEHYNNIISNNGTILYAYRITPINSLFSGPEQLTELLSTMRETLRKVNMPGTIAILSSEQNPKDILNYYQSNYEKNGFPVLEDWFKKVYHDTAIQLSEKINYNYFIYVIFEDGKISMLKKQRFFKQIKADIPLTKGYCSVLSNIEEDLFLKLRDTGDLDVKKISTREEIEFLFNRFSFPGHTKTTASKWDVIPTESHLKYVYIRDDGSSGTTLAKNFILQENKNLEVSDQYGNIGLNQLQLQSTPTDVFIKFELKHHGKFLKEINSKFQQMKRANQKYQALAKKKDKDYETAKALIQVANEVDLRDNQYDFVYQMQFRIAVHEDNVDELNARYAFIRKNLLAYKLEIDGGSGIQNLLAKNVFPQLQTHFKHIQISDPIAFTNFNYLGGFYIGHENRGLIIGNEIHSQKQVLYDTGAILKKQAKTMSPTIAIVGTTGSGKSQLQNHEALLFATVLGIPGLTIDPKNDRSEIVKQLGPNVASVLEIGGQGSTKGMFDPYLTNLHNLHRALEEAQQLIISIERVVNSNSVIDLELITEAHERICFKAKAEKKNPTFTMLIDEIYRVDPNIIKNTRALKNHRFISLLFGDENTDVNKAFDFSKPYNLITFVDGKNLVEGSKDIKDLEFGLFGVIVREVQKIVSHFQKQYPGKRKYLAIDELALYKKYPGATSALDNIVRTVRSDFVDTRLLCQKWSDIPKSVESQIEMAFISGQRDEEDIQAIRSHFKLENNNVLLPYFTDLTKLEGVQQDKKHNFVCIDYNNRKCVVKLKFLDCFTEMLNTSLSEDVVE